MNFDHQAYNMVLSMSFHVASIKARIESLKSTLIVPPSHFRDALLYDYSRQTLTGLSEIVEREYDDKLLQKALKTYLSSLWELVKGTYLCYTSIPDSDITDLLVEIAEKLGASEEPQAESKYYSSALSILMPGVAVESIEPTEFPDLDNPNLSLKSILKTHVLGWNGRYLIPVSLLVKKAKIAPSMPLPNVYYDVFAEEGSTTSATLNNEELDRLYGHSALTRRLRETREAYAALSEDETHLLGQCHALLKHMYFASVGGIGQEKVAANSVYPVMQSFFDYYFALGRKAISSLPKEFSAEITLLHQYFTGEKKADIGSCLATRRNAIQLSMSKHEEQLSMMSLSGDERGEVLARAKDDFEKARDDLEKSITISPIHYQGEDKLPLTSALVANTHTLLKFHTYQEAVTLINGLTPLDITTLFAIEKVKSSLYQSLKTIEDWAMLVIFLSEDKLSALLAKIGKDRLTRVLMADMDLFIAFLAVLNPIRRGILLDYIDIDKKDNNGNTALMWAIVKGQKDIARELIEQGASLNEKDNNGFTALMVAIEKGQIDIARELIELGASLNEKENNGKTALMLAIIFRQVEIAFELIEQGASLNEKSNHGYPALMYAIEKSQKDIAHALIKQGARLNDKYGNGYTALMYAIEKSQKVLVREIIEQGASPDEKDSNGNTALMWAIKRREEEIARELIEQGASLNEKDRKGNTALMLAMEKREKGIALALIEQGASLNEKDRNGNTALMLAMKKGEDGIALALIEQGASLNEKDRYGNTSLMLAIIFRKEKIALALIKKGASLDKKFSSGNTLLMCAIDIDQKNIALALIKKGASLKEKNIEGKSALDFALRRPDHLVIVKAIIKKKTSQALWNSRFSSWLPFFKNKPNKALQLQTDEATENGHSSVIASRSGTFV